jgi:hypothetical protein
MIRSAWRGDPVIHGKAEVGVMSDSHPATCRHTPGTAGTGGSRAHDLCRRSLRVAHINAMLRRSVVLPSIHDEQ